MIVSFLIGAVVVVLVVVGGRTSRTGYESASSQVARSSGTFELRDYPALSVAETPMTGTSNNANGSFMRLFCFITGGNEANQKFAMTTPVLMSGNDSNATMAFVLPAKSAARAVPKPTDGSVIVRELPAGQFAVLRFSGTRHVKTEAVALQRLKTGMTKAGLRVLSPPGFAYFDPPWTPGFLRRNEVMLRTEETTQ
jgi:DNA gyrase inhibitor GyrI